MIITSHGRDGIPAAMRRRLDDLAQRWPVGMAVRHEAGWTGRVVPDFAGNIHGLGLDVAHCLVTATTSAVCVEATINGHVATIWYRPEVLRPVGKAKPAPGPKTPRERVRTRRAA